MQHGVALRARTFGGVRLLPMLRYMDNVALVEVGYLREEVFGGEGARLVRRCTFIEDTFGKTLQMRRWLGSAECARKEPPRSGCWLFGGCRLGL